MRPEALQVLADALREAGESESEIARVLMHADQERSNRRDVELANRAEQAERSWWMTTIQQIVDPADRMRLTSDELLEVVEELARPNASRVAALVEIERQRRRRGR